MPSTITVFNTFTPATKAKSSEVNQNFNNYRGTLVPINESTATASDFEHDLGSADHRWKRAHIGAGFLAPGMIMPVHNYNGLISAATYLRGWMKCDGRVVSSANYDAEYSVGAWAREIVSSPLDGLYLPNLANNKYLTGSSVTSLGGTAAMSYVGNSSSAINLTHSHATVAHNHAWYSYNDTNHVGQSYDVSGGLQLTQATASITGILVSNNEGDGLAKLAADSYTNDAAPSTGTTLSASQSVKPWSLEVMYYMRII